MGDWFKSSFSGPTQNCVEMKHDFAEYIHIRDSKDPDSPILFFTRNEIAAFIQSVKKGEFDNLVGEVE